MANTAYKITEEDKKNAKLLLRWRRHPKVWVEHMFNLKPQPHLPEYEDELRSCIESQQWEAIKPYWFQPFIRGQHITWQQWIILESVSAAMRGLAPRRISIRSGHGIGKSCTCSWIMLWFLMCFPNCRIGATAPSSDQLHDVLWTETKKWIDKMPDQFKNLYEWQGSYIRMAPDREKWWARARTARKETPEALAGLHAEDVLMIVDEASGVHNAIFNTAEGALTDKNTLVIMISNPTRLSGYFYDSHHGDKDAWQRHAYSCLDSPVIDTKYVSRILEKHGDNSDEYRIRVKGEFPDTESMDDDGFVPLFSVDKVLKTIDNTMNLGKKRLGVDVAGSGDDTTVWVIRDAGKAKIVAEEKTSTTGSLIMKTTTLMDQYNLDAEDVFLDMFGEGAKVAQGLARIGHMVRAVNVGDSLDKRVEGEEDKKRFRNKRAHAYWRLRDWLYQGGELVGHEKWDEQLASIRYRRGISGSIEIMSKIKMRKNLIKSPDHLDALMLTFVEPDYDMNEEYTEWEDGWEDGDDIDGGAFG